MWSTPCVVWVLLSVGGGSAVKPGVLPGVVGVQVHPFDFRMQPPAESGIDFRHHSGASGTAKRFMIECVGTGLGLVDVDDDGDLDLYLPQGGFVREDGSPAVDEACRDALYLNDGTGRFARAAACGELSAGFAFGVTAADVDGDGDEDLFVACLGLNDLLINDGQGRFRCAPQGGGLAGGEDDWTMAAAFADVDGDGDLDAFLTHYLAHDLTHELLASGRPCRWVGCEVPCGPEGLTPQPDRFYLNDGEGNFTDVTGPAGFDAVEAAYGFQAVFCDFDGDHDPDLFVANDSVPNNLWRNDGPGADGIPRFTETGMRAGVALSETGKDQAGMGVAVGDIDADGREDIVMTNFSQEQNALFHNASNGKIGLVFFEESVATGLGWPSYFDLGWGASFLDADLDGDLDLFVANGHIYPQVDGCDIHRTTYAQRNRMFEQIAPGRFEDVTGGSGSGLEPVLPSRGCAAGDLDGDGDLDLIVTNLDAPPTVLMNHSRRRGGWIRLDLRPVVSSVGARVELVAGDKVQIASPKRGTSFLGTEDRCLHFGVPADAKDVLVTVRWPGGAVERFEGLPTGRTVRLVRGAGTP